MLGLGILAELLGRPFSRCNYLLRLCRICNTVSDILERIMMHARPLGLGLQAHLAEVLRELLLTAHQRLISTLLLFLGKRFFGFVGVERLA